MPMDDKRMSEQTPYQKLEVSEDASFEEIQSARDRLVTLHTEDEKVRQDVEMAYDAILMDRLRRRQAGEIKVPERIRFAEQLAEKQASFAMPSLTQSPDWLQRLLDRPSGQEVLVTSIVWLVLGGLAIAAQWGTQAQSNDASTQQALSFLLAVGIGFNVFWIQRKELKLGRAVLITIAMLVLGGVLSAGLLQIPWNWGGVDLATIVALVVFVLFWVASNFLR